MSKLLLFDIDGTLLNLRYGVSRKIFADTLGEFFGTTISDSSMPSFAGQTDTFLIKTIAENNNLDVDLLMSNFPALREQMLPRFERACSEGNLSVLAGADNLLNRLRSSENYQIGLLTGNFRQNAYLKLRYAALDHYFEFGAFGCDHIDRNQLPPLAIDRANLHACNIMFDYSNTIIIGDSAKDIECAKSNSIAVLAVATGGTETKELKKHNPDRVVADLTDTHNILEILSEL